MSIEVPDFKGSAPTMFKLSGNVLPLHSYAALEHDKKKAKNCAIAMRDSIGGFKDHLPPIPLANDTEDIVAWLLLTQCAILSYTGLNLTPQSFGAPAGFAPMNPSMAFTMADAQ